MCSFTNHRCGLDFTPSSYIIVFSVPSEGSSPLLTILPCLLPRFPFSFPRFLSTPRILFLSRYPKKPALIFFPPPFAQRPTPRHSPPPFFRTPFPFCTFPLRNRTGLPSYSEGLSHFAFSLPTFPYLASLDSLLSNQRFAPTPPNSLRLQWSFPARSSPLQKDYVDTVPNGDPP